jgi:hypothetical protein
MYSVQTMKSTLRTAAFATVMGAALGLTPLHAQVLTSNNSLGEAHSISTSAGATYASQWRGANGFTDGASSFWAYCIDPRTSYVNSSTYVNTSLANFLGASGRYASEFAQAAYTSTASTGYVAQNIATVQNSLMNLYKAAAFSYAVWEIIGESSYNTNTGGLRSNDVSAWRTQTDAYLSALSTNSWSNVNGVNLNAAMSYLYTVYYTSAQGASQTFLRVSQNTGVPEPGSLALTAGALLALVTMARRQRKQPLVSGSQLA